MLRDRLNQYKLTKNFSNRDLSSHLGIDEQKIGKILNGRYQGSFEEFEEIVSKISDTPNDEYYYSTGKHLQQEPTQATPCTTEIQMLSNTINQLSQIITQLSARLDDLSAEIRGLKEEKRGSRVHIRQKVPEDH